MKRHVIKSISDVVLPLAVYLLSYRLIFLAVNCIFPAVPPAFSMGISAAGTLFILFPFYKDTRQRFSQGGFMPSINNKSLIIMIIIIVSLSCIALNFFMSGFIDSDRAYKAASVSLNSGNIIVRIISEGMIIPALEETVFRGIIMRRIFINNGKAAALLVPALLFGAVHMNMIQFIYASLSGILVGLTMMLTGRLYAVYSEHVIINMTVLLFGMI